MPEGSPSKKVFPAGKLAICHFSVEEVPCVSIAELGHMAVSCPKLRQLND